MKKLRHDSDTGALRLSSLRDRQPVGFAPAVALGFVLALLVAGLEWRQHVGNTPPPTSGNSTDTAHPETQGSDVPADPLDFNLEAHFSAMEDLGLSIGPQPSTTRLTPQHAPESAELLQLRAEWEAELARWEAESALHSQLSGQAASIGGYLPPPAPLDHSLRLRYEQAMEAEQLRRP